VRVAAAPAVAFDLFTREIDQWWRRGPKYRHAGSAAGRIAIEPGAGGRVFETWRDGGGGERSFEIGRITVWEPPHRLAFGWRNEEFAAAERTEVEVTFVAVGAGTLVTVRHRGWETLRKDHPARHGLDDAAFARMLGLWWSELLEQLRRRAAAP
jgi:uncharacterized protein YndB with AHSA1/START domain